MFVCYDKYLQLSKIQLFMRLLAQNHGYAHNVRITRLFEEFTMPALAASARKRPVNLTLNEALVAQAKAYTSNLSATMESLLTEFVTSQQQAQRSRQQVADTCAADWNAVHAVVGSFADEHSTL